MLQYNKGHTIKQEQNRGIILGEYSDETYVGGTIPYEERNPSGDWTPWVPIGEKQAGKEDYMDCTCRSLTSDIEIQEKFFTGKESNYSDRFLAKRSGVTRLGNYLDKVVEQARKDGLVNQSSWNDTWGTWEEQYAEPTPDEMAKLLSEGQEWLSKWDIKYEKIPYDKKSLQYHLKHAPLWLVIPGHAIVGIHSPNDVDEIYDSYSPFLKSIPGYIYPSKPIYAMKVVLYKKEDALDPDSLFIDLKFGDLGTQVLKLKRALYRLGWFSGQGDIYDEELAMVVKNYKKAGMYGDNMWLRWGEEVLYKGRPADKVTRENI